MARRFETTRTDHSFMLTRTSRQNFRSVCILALLLIAAFFDVVFLGKTFKVTTANSQALPNGVYGQADNKPKFIPVNGTDTPVQEEPIYEFIKQNLKRGIFPLWNPHQACGYPLIGMIEVAFFYPLNLILYSLPNTYAWDVLVLVRILLGGLFLYCYMRHLRMSVIPSLCAGIVWMLSGPLVLLQYWTTNVDILLPLLLIAADQIIARPRKESVFWLALGVCLTFLGGHPEHIFLVNAYMVVYFAFRLCSVRRAEQVRSIRLFGAGIFLGIGMSAVVLFPFLQNLLLEFWHGHPPGTGLLMEEQRERALTLALPHFFQNVPLTFQWEFSGWWGGYLGTIPLGLAFLSLFAKQKRGLNYFFAVLVLLIVGKEYGLPVINWLGALPLFNKVRYAIHTPPLAAMTAAILAGMGARMILSRRKLFLKMLIYSALLTALICAHLYFRNPSLNMSLALRASLFAAGLLTALQTIVWLKDRGGLSRRAAAIGLTALAFIELFCYIHRERPARFDSFAPVPYIEQLKSSPEKMRSYGNFWAFYPNTATGFQTDDLGFFFGLAPKRFVEFVNNLLIPNHFRNDLRPPALRAIPIQDREHLLDLLNVTYIITPATDEYSRHFPHFENLEEKYTQVYAGEVRIYQRPHAYPRAFVVHRAVFETDQVRTMLLLNSLNENLRGVAVIKGRPSPEMLKILEQTPPVDNSTAVITKSSANEVIVQARMQNPGFLVLSEAYHPDWQVTIDGKKGNILQTDHLLRSVFLPAGDHTVRFVFKPFSFYLGLGVSLLSLTAGLVLLLVRRSKDG